MFCKFLENKVFGRTEFIYNSHALLSAILLIYKEYSFILSGIDHQQMKDLGEKYFGNLGKTDDTSLQKDLSYMEPCRFTGGDVSSADRKCSQYCTILFP
jgi:hypothetical protein